MKWFILTDSLETPTLKAEVCEPPDMICITEDHSTTDQAENEDVYIDMGDAYALRDWLNKVLP
jgi:hypothetical protein